MSLQLLDSCLRDILFTILTHTCGLLYLAFFSFLSLSLMKKLRIYLASNSRI